MRRLTAPDPAPAQYGTLKAVARRGGQADREREETAMAKPKRPARPKQASKVEERMFCARPAMPQPQLGPNV
ncbi:MAG: hypothetical protein ACRDJM_07520, partial [Actinomycetota bacterium]